MFQQNLFKIWTCKSLSDTFAIKSGLKEGDALLTLLFNFTPGYDIRSKQITGF